jgi:hypothetical protein
MDDLFSNVDSTAGRVRVFNFPRLPVIILGNNAAPPPNGVATPLQIVASNTPWIPDYQPTPTDAPVAATFTVGSMVGVGGSGDTNYYPNELMNVFIEPHRVWHDGDSLITYAVHQSLVMSDSTGTLPQTQAWIASNPGTYDLIVDYDNDSKFSWKLDGISSFLVMNPTAVTDTSQTIAEDDSYSTLHDHALTVSAPGVLANDSNSYNLPLTAAPLSGPSNGTLALNPDGSFTYTPNSHFVGYDSFTYTATASDGTSATATVLINVTDTPPNAADDAYTVQHNKSLTVPAASGVLANDSDLDGDPLTAKLVDGPGNGTVTLNADGSFTYTPNPGFAGQDAFTYVANDGATDSIAAGVTITVADQLPIGQPDSYTVLHDHTLTVAATSGVLANDSDADGDPITADLITGPGYGTLTLNPNGSFTYVPNSHFAGTDTFLYIPDDGTYSNTDYYGASAVQVTITVTDRAPVANNDSYSLPKGQTLTVTAPGILGNDSDPDGDSFTISQVNGAAPAFGTPITLSSGATLTLNASGSFSYTPPASFLGTDSFTYQISDGILTSSTATVSLSVMQPQLLDGVPVSANAPPLTYGQLQPLLNEAIRRWVAVTGDAQAADRLRQADVRIAPLTGGALGLTGANTVWIDATAQGHGWFLDPTPADDSEFTPAPGGPEVARPSSPAFGRVDLLTVLAHELAHVLDLGDIDPQGHAADLMAETLAPGVRRVDGWGTVAVAAAPPVHTAALAPADMPFVGLPSAGPSALAVALTPVAAPLPVPTGSTLQAVLFAEHESELAWLAPLTPGAPFDPHAPATAPPTAGPQTLPTFPQAPMLLGADAKPAARGGQVVDLLNGGVAYEPGNTDGAASGGARSL